MQLCVIDDLIKQSADQIAQSAPCSHLQRVIKTLSKIRQRPRLSHFFISPKYTFEIYKTLTKPCRNLDVVTTKKLALISP